MTLEQFLVKLEQTPRRWRRSSQDEILCGNQCPISALLGRSAAKFSSVASELGLDSLLAVSIAQAADNDAGHDPELRAKLLKACGL